MKRRSELLLRLSLTTGLSASLLGIFLVYPVRAEKQGRRGDGETGRQGEKEISLC